MRKAFADTLCRLAAEDPRVMLLTGDLGFGVFDEYKERFPDRFVNVGISEQLLMDAAAGLAMEGYRPICYSIASFATGRAWEQIKVAIGLHRLPVMIVGAGGGYVYNSAGPTHHAPEDLGLMSMIPGMTVLNPGCPSEVSTLMEQAMQLDGPCYMRIGRYGEPEYDGSGVLIGKTRWLRSGLNDLRKRAIITTGDLAPIAHQVADITSAENDRPMVLHMHTIKPLDTVTLGYLINEVKTIIVMEEHHPHGGLYSAIASWIGEQSYPSSRPGPHLIRLGPSDGWVDGVATREALWREWRCDAESVAKLVRRLAV